LKNHSPKLRKNVVLLNRKLSIKRGAGNRGGQERAIAKRKKMKVSQADERLID